MSRFIDWLLNRIPLIKKLNGYKSYISLAIYALSLIGQILIASESVFPEIAGSGSALESFLQQIISTLETIGVSGLAVGVVHKGAKERIAKKEEQV